LIAILSREWAEEVESSSKEIHIRTPSCKVQGTRVDALYNPSIGANLMSVDFAYAYLAEISLAPTIKSPRSSPRTSLQGLGILHDTTLHHGDMEVAFDFHVFEI
jgi:hypothetical protein